MPTKESTAPTAPTNIRTVTTYATSTTTAWDAASDATSYEVWMTDTGQTGAQPVKTPLSGTTHTATNLLPNRAYHIQVYSVQNADGTPLLSTTAVEKNTTTESVIIEDVIQCPPPDEMAAICPLVCTAATVESPNIVRWSAFSARDFHKIRILNLSRSVRAQIVLERSLVSGKLCIRNYADLICDNIQLAVNPPSSVNCPSGGPALSFCGTFTDSGTTIAYRVEADIDKCVVLILPPASQSSYVIQADRCTHV